MPGSNSGLVGLILQKRLRFNNRKLLNNGVVRGIGVPNYSNALKEHQQMYLHYYVYAYLRTDGTPYYIGKGSSNRAWKKDRGEIGKPTDPTRIIIIESNLSSIGAYAIERRLISWYGRKDKNTGILRNQTDGGDGGPGGKVGRVLSQNTRKKISDGNKGKIVTDEFRKLKQKQNLEESNPFYGKNHSEELKKRFRERMQLRPKTLCPHCNREFDPTNYKRYHGDCCKLSGSVSPKY